MTGNWSVIDNQRLSLVLEDAIKEDTTDSTKKLAEYASDLLRKCLQGDAAKRPQSMAEILLHPFFDISRRQPDVDVGSRGSKKSKKTAAVQFGAEEAYPDGSFAVIVAIDKYGDIATTSGSEAERARVAQHGLPDLRFAVADAALTKKVLKLHGFQIIQELYNEEATVTGVLDLIDFVVEFLRDKPKSRFVFSLASHGLLDDDEEEGWICCHGTNTKKLSRTCIEMTKLKKLAKRITSEHQLYLLDCCHAGGLFVGSRGAPTAYQKALMMSPAIYGMTAVNENQEALEAHGHGIFTRSIANALLGHGFTNGKEMLTAGDLFSYVSQQVFETASDLGRVQTPKFEPLLSMHKKNSCDGQFLFFPPNEEALALVEVEEKVAAKKKGTILSFTKKATPPAKKQIVVNPSPRTQKIGAT